MKTKYVQTLLRQGKSKLCTIIPTIGFIWNDNEFKFVFNWLFWQVSLTFEK